MAREDSLEISRQKIYPRFASGPNLNKPFKYGSQLGIFTQIIFFRNKIGSEVTSVRKLWEVHNEQHNGKCFYRNRCKANLAGSQCWGDMEGNA